MVISFDTLPLHNGVQQKLKNFNLQIFKQLNT